MWRSSRGFFDVTGAGDVEITIRDDGRVIWVADLLHPDFPKQGPCPSERKNPRCAITRSNPSPHSSQGNLEDDGHAQDDEADDRALDRMRVPETCPGASPVLRIADQVVPMNENVADGVGQEPLAEQSPLMSGSRREQLV